MATYAPGPGRPPDDYAPVQHHHQPRWSLNDLSTELLTIILEQLRDIDCQHVFTARLLCRRFNQIAIPIAYRTLALTERILSPDAEQHFPQALAHIHAYTNHVVAKSNLDSAGTRRILDRIRSLSSVRWKYVDRAVGPEQFWMPVDVLNAEQPRYRNTRLYIEELPLRDFEGELRDIYIRAIPVDLLVSLKTAYPTPPLVTRLNSLKHLLVAARRLEILQFEDRGQGTQFDFAPHERLPAFRELSLQSYDWNHSPEEVERHWDFSRITSLKLISVPIYNFLSSVDFHHLAGLRTLHCEDFSAHHSPDQRVEATRGLHTLIRSYIRALSSVQITVHTHEFPAVDALLPHAGSLTTLSLRDHTGFDEEDRRCPTLFHEDIALLARHLRRLRALELDMDVANTDPPLFLRALCAFPSLHTLTLHVQTVINPYGPVHPGRDRDHEAAARTFQFLMSHKAGPVPWRSITINVGGWRRVLVRRLSEAWRRLNERGVFAERCFVMERKDTGDAGEAAGFVIREEFPVEASRHVTPEYQGQEGREEEEEYQYDNDDDYDDNY